MDPTSLMTFTSPVEFNKPLFGIDVYRKSDGAGTASQCMWSIDSKDWLEQGTSLGGTNTVFFFLNEYVRRPLREIPDFPKVAEHPDGATIQKVDQIFQQFLSQCPASLGTGLARERRIDLWKRVNNILQGYFKVEVPYLVRHLMKTRGMNIKEAGAFLAGKIPGSLADAIGVAVERAAIEDVGRMSSKIAEIAAARGMTASDYEAMALGHCAEARQHLDFPSV